MHQVPTIRRGAPWLLAVVAAALLALGVAPPALAHDQLVSTSPEAGSTVTTAPREISLTFNDTVVATGSRIVLAGPAGTAPDAPVRVGGATISRPAPPQATDGIYTVTWRATSSDGHPVSGTFRYTVRAAAGSSAAPVVPAGPSASSVTPTSRVPAPTSGDPGPAAHRGTGVSPWAIVVLAVMLLIVGTVIARRRMKP